jgi:hypothetical protein
MLSATYSGTCLVIVNVTNYWSEFIKVMLLQIIISIFLVPNWNAQYHFPFHETDRGFHKRGTNRDTTGNNKCRTITTKRNTSEQNCLLCQYSRPRWSSSRVWNWTQGSRVQIRLRAIKIRGTPSIGGEVNPSAPCLKILWHVKEPFEIWNKYFVG